MTITIIIENTSNDKSITVTNMTNHSWNMGALGPENINAKPLIIGPKEKATVSLWKERHLLLEEHEIK